MINDMIKAGNDIESLRNQFGLPKSAAGDIKGENPLEEIWQIISPKTPGITADQFFGFSTVVDGQPERITWQGLIACCSVLDIIGYKAEGKKVRKQEKVPNVISDAVHIATGAYCSAIISKDRRLVDRARAIYKYRNIATSALLLELKEKK